MELIIVLAALCIVSVLAMRFGYDSRLPAQSKEQDLANFGMSWEEPAGTTPGGTWRKAAFVRFGLFRGLMDPRCTPRAVFRKANAR